MMMMIDGDGEKPLQKLFFYLVLQVEYLTVHITAVGDVASLGNVFTEVMVKVSLPYVFQEKKISVERKRELNVFHRKV